MRALGSLATPQPRTPLHPGSVSLVGRGEDARDPPLFTEPTPPIPGGSEGARNPPHLHTAPPTTLCVPGGWR